MQQTKKLTETYSYCLQPFSWYSKTFQKDFKIKHKHNTFELMYAEENDFEINFFLPNSPNEPMNYTVYEGQFILIDSNVTHQLIINGDNRLIHNLELWNQFQPYKEVEIDSFNTENFVKINYTNVISLSKDNFSQLYKNGFLILTDLNFNVKKSLQQYFQVVNKSITSYEQAILAQCVLCTLFVYISQCSKAKHDPTPAYIRATNRFISQNFTKKITIEQIAEHTKMNKFYLQRQYKKYTGKTLLYAINALRIESAKQMLATTNYSISQIAVKTGFSERTHFNYEFQKFEGCSPSDYRKNTNEIPFVDINPW